MIDNVALRCSRWLRVWTTRPWFAIVALAGGLTAWAVPPDWGLVTRVLVGWDVAVWGYLAITLVRMLRSSASSIRAAAELQDETATVFLVMVCLATLMSLLAIGFELSTAKGLGGAASVMHLAVTGLTVVGSWLLLPVIFSVHYAHAYHLADAQRRPLIFPDADDTAPGYADFFYFAITIAVAAQTADVALRGSTMRLTVSAQAVLAFIFNAAVLGLTINIAAGLVSG